ncbi:DUF2637 domain-containing protein [Streptomyces lutosisoli]|uniref:DUF2637 domain-containing protein n=1 Tax=Streptomyces lutosisoli TaxID=2665721 RepID=UPI00360F563C
MAAGNGEIPQLTRTHRVLIGVVVTGAVVIAGIGFAGSYAAVRELALKKGFGSFAYVFPVGVDAGICVLLAMDLLLTWIRIPFPLLRQTAWLLTAATIAFNGAAAWPDALGVGMHAVIPVLFVVAVEAARHAIGRIADITADKHMEGVRLTRWLLSPVPTFLLLRRMKLWELRSYDQVIKLEQERLVYQASLRSRFGRAWRRKAPVEALMPLRLARFGVPLAETAPAGLAAAGIEEPPIVFTVERAPASVRPDNSTPDATAEHKPTAAEPDSAEPQPVRAPVSTSTSEQPHDPQESTEETAERFAEAYRSFIAEFQVEPSAAQWALWLRDTYGISTGSGGPLSEGQAQPLLQVLKARYALHREEPQSLTRSSRPTSPGTTTFTAPGAPTRRSTAHTRIPRPSPRTCTSGTPSPGTAASPSRAMTWQSSSRPSRSASSATANRPPTNQPPILASRPGKRPSRRRPNPRRRPSARVHRPRRRSAPLG